MATAKALSSGLQKVLALCERRGFIYSSSIKTGNSMCRSFLYGPLGTELKRNIVNEWWHVVVTSMGNVYPLDSPVVSSTENPNASGVHLINTTGQNFSSDGKGFPITKEENNSTSYYIRPHLTQAVFYEQYKKTMNVQLPFGIAEVGKVFSNQSEVGPIFSLNEHELGSIQFFCAPTEYKNWFSKWQKMRLRWWKKFAINPEKFVLSKKDCDSELFDVIEFQFPQSPYSVESITDGAIPVLEDKDGSVQSFISITTSIDQAVLAYICDAYVEVTSPYTKFSSTEKNTVLRFHASLAPYKVAVLPRDTNNPKLNMYCRRLAEELRQVGIATANTNHFYDSFEEQLMLQDEMGTPFRIIASDETLDTGTVFLQDRDTTVGEEMNGRDVMNILQKMLLSAKLN